MQEKNIQFGPEDNMLGIVSIPNDINSLCMVDAGTTGEITDTTFTDKNDLK